MKFWSNFCGNEARLQCNGCRADSLTQFSRNHHRHHHHRPSGACRQFDPILSQSRRQPAIFHPGCSFSTLGWISALPCNRCRWIFWISVSLQQNRCRWILDFWISALPCNRSRWISVILPPCNRTDAAEKEIERQKAAPATHPIFIILSNWNDTVMVTRCSNV